ncbi:polyribonucleotide 5'-hydroxyl-kinase Clp1-like [Oscarella lobularis]|uniref:polyribonucleotide 5'-hydroxyl-kinase Clp1-like n=1 Tax=Oscarella lobularis TaxID=121494 RepID=UPI0033133823
MDASTIPVAEWSLSAQTELRFEVEDTDPVTLKLLDGTAEIFGTELPPSQQFSFADGAKVAVFTWHGCRVQLRGRPLHPYVSTDTPMVAYLNAHAALEKMRESVERARDLVGPRVVIVGSKDVGKTTLCRILLGYATRWGRQPVYVDLDCGQNSISVPGCVAALPVDRPADVEEGTFALRAPLVFHYGSASPSENSDLYLALISELARVVRRRFGTFAECRASGCVVNTCGWIDGFGFKAIVHAVMEFDANVVLVLDQERLFSQLKTSLGSSVQVVLLPKSGGVVSRSRSFRNDARMAAVRKYFYGTAKESLYPHSFNVGFDDVLVFKIGQPRVPDSCLPLDAKKDDSATKVVSVALDMDLLHCVCGLSLASGPSEDLARTNVAGFVVVTDVSMEKRTLTLLSPAAHPLPRNCLLISDIRFVDMK